MSTEETEWILLEKRLEQEKGWKKKQLEKEAEDRKERDCECKCHKEESK